MKKILSLSLTLLLISVACVAQATPMLIVEQTSTASGFAYAISLDPGDRNGTFGTIQVDVSATAPAEFINPDDSGFNGTDPLAGGDDLTTYNGALADPARFGGLDFAIPAKSVSANSLSFGGGPLGAFIEVGAPFLLANVVLPANGFGEAAVQLIDGQGVTFQTLTVPLGVPVGVPEPTSLMLAGLGLIGFVARRR